MVGVQALVILAGILIMLYGGNSLTPAINTAHDAGVAGQPRFEQLHRRAVQLNALVLVIGLCLLVAFANSSRPAYIRDRRADARRAGPVRQRDQSPDRRRRSPTRPAPPRVLAPGESPGRDPLIDDETEKEVESFYDRKRQRDEARTRGNATPN